MQPLRWSCDEVIAALLVPGEPELAAQLVAVHGRATVPAERLAQAVERLAMLPCVVVGTPGDRAEPALVDAWAADDRDLQAIATTFAQAPVAATALAVHLRGSDRRTVADGLVAESALYSTLQAGPEHRSWLDGRPERTPSASIGERLRVERVGDELQLTLQRPEARNALDVALRDELLAALAVAAADTELRVVVRGEGPAFCAGGDLTEFGTAPDPATAHLIRLRASVGAALHRVAERTTVHVHGPCAGSGVELPAFAGRVVAAPDTTFVLPELAMGLVPGAGGTVSLPRRIGRHRTAWLALTQQTIEAPTARAWSLVDEIALI